MTEASTFAGENVFGSFNKEMTLKSIVLENLVTIKHFVLFPVKTDFYYHKNSTSCIFLI